jgi:hypothetical protein
MNYEMTNENIDQWCFEGWIDLREENLGLWQKRFETIRNEAENIKYDLTSSRNYFDKKHWDNFESISPGKLAAWIFEKEEDGWRFKR